MGVTNNNSRQGDTVPGENFNPEALQGLQRLGITFLAGLLGLLVRIGEKIRDGHREKFWSPWLLSDLIGLAVTVAVSAGIAEYLMLGPWGTSAVAVVLGRGGPSLIDGIMLRFTGHKWRPK